MTTELAPFGFRVVGDATETRRLVDAAAAFSAHAADDPRAETHRECYLSAFQFGDDFRAHLETHDTTKGFSGLCWARWLWFDIDRENDLSRLNTAGDRTPFLRRPCFCAQAQGR